VAARLTLHVCVGTPRARPLAAADQLPLLKLVMARSALHAAFGRMKGNIDLGLRRSFKRWVLRISAVPWDKSEADFGEWMMTSSLCGGVLVPTALRDVQRPFRITTDGGMSQKPNRTKPDTQFKA
jgi:hypothetical protein